MLNKPTYEELERQVAELKHAEKALKRERGLLKSVMQATDVMLVYLDPDFNFVWVNAAYAATCNYNPADMVGKNHFALYPNAENEAIFRRVRDSGKPVFYKDKSFEFPDQPERGVTYWDWSLVPVKDAAGKVQGLVFSLRETTKPKRAEEALRDSEQRYRRLFEDDLTGDFVATGDGEILLCNPAFVRIYGFADEQEAVGTSFPALKADPGGWLRLLEQLQREGRVQGREVNHRRRDGRIIHVVENVIAFFDADSKLIRIQGYVFDDTERNRAEEELRQAKADLERKVQERTAQLAQRAAQLRALAGELTLSEQRERRRIAKVLHDELQQILVSAKFRTILLGRSMDQVNREAAGEVEVILDEAINVSRTLTAELSPPILHEAGLVPGLEWLARWMLNKHGLAVDVTTAPGLLDIADDLRVLLFESVRELLLNAIKHARVPSAGVSVRPIGPDQVQIMVSDAGPGFDPAQVKPAGSGGGGFGLFSIRERLDLIGGRMEIESAPGEGSRFTLIVPVRQPEAAAPAKLVPAIKAAVEKAPGAAQPNAGLVIRVLLADDHVVMREGLARLLGQESDIDVVGQAADGKDAVELARKLLPDVILMDVAMPKLTGIEATRAILTEYPDISIIGLSMFEEPERAQAFRDAGAAAYLAKSGPPGKLMVTIRKCMARKVASGPKRKPRRKKKLSQPKA